MIQYRFWHIFYERFNKNFWITEKEASINQSQLSPVVTNINTNLPLKYITFLTSRHKKGYFHGRMILLNRINPAILNFNSTILF